MNLSLVFKLTKKLHLEMLLFATNRKSKFRRSKVGIFNCVSYGSSRHLGEEHSSGWRIKSAYLQNSAPSRPRRIFYPIFRHQNSFPSKKTEYYSSPQDILSRIEP